MIGYINFLLICITLLPKINIIDVGSNSTGIRIEDLLIALYILLDIVSIIKTKKKNIESTKMKKVIKIFMIFIFVCLLATIYGVYREWIRPIYGILYLIRKIEYFWLLFIGYQYMRKIKDDSKILNKIDFLVYIHFIFTILQLLRNNAFF